MQDARAASVQYCTVYQHEILQKLPTVHQFFLLGNAEIVSVKFSARRQWVGVCTKEARHEIEPTL
jgi:hypothetical protein